MACPITQGDHKKAASPSHMDDSIVFAPHQLHASLTHPTTHPKQHLDRFSCFCTGHGRESLYFIMGRPFSPSQLPVRMRDQDHLRHVSMGHKSTTQIASLLVRPFLHSSLPSVPTLYNGPLLSREGSGSHPKYGFLGLPKSTPQQHIDHFSHFCKADTQTDHTTPSVTTGHIYV